MKVLPGRPGVCERCRKPIVWGITVAGPNGPGGKSQPVTTWGGWDCKPRQCITWTELDTLLDQDPRLDDLATWSTNLTAIDAWKDRMRPFELWLDADRWHPSWIEGDHERPGWPQRLQAWETTITILNDTIGKLP